MSILIYNLIVDNYFMANENEITVGIAVKANRKQIKAKLFDKRPAK